MLLPLLAFLQASPAVDSPLTVGFCRGAPLYGPTSVPTYQDVEDTVLDRNTPDTPHGGDYTLVGGEGRTILIRFGSLASASSTNATVVDATLLLTPSSSYKLTLGSIGVVNRPWGEGPFKTLGNPIKPGVEPPKDNSNAFAATWKARMAGVSGAAWRTPGAIGPDVTPIADAKGSARGNQFEISGLGPAVNAMLTDPGSNQGFALTFASDAEFYSSESSIGKPVLRVTFALRGDASPGDVVVEDIVPIQGGFTAHLQNRGREAVSGLQATWTVDAQQGPTAALPGTIAPGQRQEVRFDGSVRTNGSDHRYGALTLRVTSGANDRLLADKQLTVYTAGIPISVQVSSASLNALLKSSGARGRGPANWVQSQLDFVNEVVLARSRYSFSPEGCRERVRLAEIKEVGPLIDGPAPIGIPVEMTVRESGAIPLDFDFIRRVLIAIGAPNLALSDFPLGSANVKIADWNVGGLSLYPDLTGGGDTRYDGGLARQSLLPEIPTFDSALSAPGLEPTGLLSLLAVGALNALLQTSTANRPAARVSALSIMPTTVLLSAYDASGTPLKHVDLTFFQSHGGVVSGDPAFTVATGDTGAALLPRRGVPGAQLTNAFGSRDIPADGAFLVRASGPNGTGWGWLKAWQLTDAAYRGDTEFASVPLYVFMTAGSIDRSVNRAVGRIVTDSAGSLPAKLSPLVDGQAKTSIALPEKAGDWIEVDLNRDWTLAELRLTALNGTPWKRFAIKVYQTGQRAANAVEWFSEANWAWSAQNRGVVDKAGRVTVVYDGPAVQIRYIRIVCLEAGQAGLAQIEAFSTRSGS